MIPTFLAQFKMGLREVRERARLAVRPRSLCERRLDDTLLCQLLGKYSPPRGGGAKKKSAGGESAFPGGVEPPTSRLTVARSNQLS